MTTTDHELAAELATEAGRLLMDVRAHADGLAPRALGDRGDRESNAFLMDALRTRRPDDAILSEEEADSTARLSASRVWIVDPLDGTREFSEDGREDWAVHVALWAGDHLDASAVALPAAGRTLSTVQPPVVPPRGGRPLRLVVSRSRPPAMTEAVASAIGAEIVTLGSAGAKAMAVVEGHADVYLHAGGQYEWDSAAPVGVALAAGLYASRINGDALVYNQADPYLPDLLLCRPELAPPVLAAIAGGGTVRRR